MNGDGTTDVALVHGTANLVSVLLNQLNGFVEYGAGKAGTGGIVPSLRGSGYSTPGGQVVVTMSGGLGGALSALFLGIRNDSEVFPYLVSLAPPPLILFLPLSGPAGVAGAGGWQITDVIPQDVTLVGVAVGLQVLVNDAGAGAPAPFARSATNGLELTIVD